MKCVACGHPQGVDTNKKPRMAAQVSMAHDLDVFSGVCRICQGEKLNNPCPGRSPELGGYTVKPNQCIAQMFYATANSGRVMADGEKRYMKGDQCLRTASWVGKDGSKWCGQHIRNPHVEDNYGPFTRLPGHPPRRGGGVR